jgi:hypothetical protein
MTAKLSRQPDLLMTTGAAVVCAVVCLAVHVSLVRVLFAVPLCLICPGYAVTAALFARSSIETPARLMLALGLSLVTLVLGGVVLNSAGGIYEVSWIVLLLLVVGISSAVAIQRRDARGAVALPHWRPGRRQLINGAVLLLALAIAVGAIVASRVPLGAPNSVGYETLSIVSLAGRSGVHLEVSSARQHTASYRLRVYVGARLVNSQTLRLKPGDSASVTLKLSRAPTPRTVDASVVMLGGHWTPRRVELELPAAST